MLNPQDATGATGLDYYQILEVAPGVEAQALRQAHRELSKLYHPDTTRFPGAIARLKFEQIQQAYEVLGDPARRFQYDMSRGIVTPFPSAMPSQPSPATTRVSNSMYLDAEARSLSSGEVFSLFILAFTFLACLVLALALGFVRGEAWMPLPSWQSQALENSAVLAAHYSLL